MAITMQYYGDGSTTTSILSYYKSMGLTLTSPTSNDLLEVLTGTFNMYSWLNINNTTYSTAGDSSGYSIIHFFTPTVIGGIKLSEQGNQGIVEVLVSNDNVEYTSLGSFDLSPYTYGANTGVFEIDLENSKAYSYYKFQMSGGRDWLAYFYWDLYINPLTFYALQDTNSNYYSLLDKYYDSTTQTYNPVQLSELSDNLCSLEDIFSEKTIGDETFVPIEKIGEAKLLTILKNKQMTINGVKNLSEMIVANDTFNVLSGEYLDYQKFSIEGTGNVKVILCADGKWLTYNSTTSKFEEISVTVPDKNYSEFNDTDKSNWENTKNIILSNGIPIDTLSTLDTRVLKMSKVKFAYAFQKANYDDVCNTSKIDYAFSVEGGLYEMSQEEYVCESITDSIRITPNTENEMITINIIK